LEVVLEALVPVDALLAGLEEDALGVRQLAREPVEYLVERVAGPRRLVEQHGLLHRRGRQQPLLPDDLVERDGRQDGVQPRHVLLRHEHADLPPRDGVREGEHDVVGDDHRDAPEHHRLHQPGAPRRPPQRAQAEDGPLHVLVVRRRVLRRDVEQRVVLEVLPHRRPRAAGVVPALGIIPHVVEKPPKIHEDRARRRGADAVRLHLAGIGVRRHGDRPRLEAGVVALAERLHQRGAPEHREDAALDGALLLVVEAGAEVVRREEEVVGAVGAVPVGPRGGDVADGAAHDARGAEGEREALRGEVAGGVGGCVEPVGLLRVEGAHGAGEEELVHEDLRREHVLQAPAVLGQQVQVVLAWHLVHEHLQLPRRVVLQHVAALPCTIHIHIHQLIFTAC
ncbi:Os01g0926450, partial [Oryza sativa Japonica Group]